MIQKHYGIDFKCEADAAKPALTLSPSCIGSNASGWKISGQIVEDYYEWVNAFEAVHPTHGEVKGDFESVVYADSEEGFKHFWAHHQPISWDYYDI